jgi:predicted CXXCH cytochrome family protein
MTRQKCWLPLLLVSLLPCLFFSCAYNEEILRRALDANAIPGASYVGSENCALCHAKEAKEFKQSSHDRITVPLKDSKVEGCEMCHGPGSLHVDAADQDKKSTIVNLKKNPEACFSCHPDKKAEFKLPYHHPVLEGHMSCTDCHDPHGAEPDHWSTTSLESANERCFQCHKEQRGPFVIEHAAMREGCAACHQVHGSVNDKLLSARDSNACLQCHTSSDFPSVTGDAHATRISQGVCFSGGCHVSVHGSNFDKHLRY